MKKIVRLSFSIILIFSIMASSKTSFADNVDGQKARQVGAYFMASQFGNKSITADNIKLVYTISNKTLDIPALYVYNTADKSGFVIVSGSNCVSPIIAYSTDGPFDPENIPTNMMAWLNEQVELIACAQNSGLSPMAEEKAAWSELEHQRLPYFGSTSKAITRLLTSTWNQEPLYNSMCPRDSQGRLTVTGCVATAMAQVLYYWRYPYVGSNSYYYNWNGQRLSADFYQTYYDYDAMTDALDENSTQEAIDAVALLSYHCGIAVNMVYGFDGSSSTADKMPKALRKYFKYDADSMQYFDRTESAFYNPNNQTSPNAKDTAWVDMLIHEIQMRRPVLYAAFSPDSNNNVHAGHAFVCDGYNSDTRTLHFNWGWGGRGDCWCNVYTSRLRIAFMGLNYTSNHRIVVGVTPPKDSVNFVGIREVESPFTASIYPNPANDQVTISYNISDNAEMQIFDATGREVERVTLYPTGSQTTLSVANYRPGIYICRLNGRSMKFVVR